MYTVLIDEAGDVGLKDVAKDPSFGPTQYFCACATILDESKRNYVEQRLSQLPFSNEILHASRLSHFEKCFFAREVCRLPVACVGVISNKLTLLEYLTAAQKTPTHYYNKVLQYLFEKVGDVLGKFRIPSNEVRIRLEAREQQYSSLISFLGKIQKNPLDERSLSIRNIDRFAISAIKKTEDRCMSISDLGAHALFSSVRRDHRAFGLSETRYLFEMRGAFLAQKDKRFCGGGIKLIHSLDDIGLPEDVASFLGNLSNPKKEFCRM